MHGWDELTCAFICLKERGGRARQSLGFLQKTESRGKTQEEDVEEEVAMSGIQRIIH